MSSRTCEHCGCNEIDVDPSRGDAVCTNCGSVLEDNVIVSEVQFEENSYGGARAIGQLVTSEGQTPGLNIGFPYGTGKDSEKITLQNARTKIMQVADQLRLNQSCIDMATNMYKMALNKRFTRGRKNSHVIAACIYIVCRTEKTPHMLLDLSDIVQVNVFDLGKTYLKLSSMLNLSLPVIDPSLYITRFAHRLQFGDKTHKVSNTAMRLVQRMTRDWMHTGRRPSGLCGAALLVAARLHEFSRTVKDVIKVVRVCEATLRKRLTEFSETPSSRLTLDEFMNIDLEEEQDPPCFTQARKKQKKQEKLEKANEDFTKEISELQKLIEKALEKKNKKQKDPNLTSNSLTLPKETSDTSETNLTEQFIVEETLGSIQEFVKDDNSDTDDRSRPESGYFSTVSAPSPLLNLRPTAASLGLKDSIEECMKKKTVEDQGEETGELDLTGLDDEELNSYLMTEEEATAKTQLWMKLNAEYLKEIQEREERRAKEDEENSNKTNQRKRKRQTRKRNNVEANSTREALEMMIQEKKLSRKINYEVLENLYNNDTKQNDIQKTPDEMPTKPPSKRPKPTVKGGSPPENIKGVMSSILQQIRSQSSPAIDDENEVEEPKCKVLCTDSQKAEEILQTQSIPDEKENFKEELAEEDLDDLDDYEEEEEHLSAAQLLQQHRGGEDSCYSGGEDEYYD